MYFKNTILSLTLILIGLTLFAQTDPGWQWAKRGGGPGDIGNGPLHSYEFERVVDLVVDADDNYYFLAEISGHQYSDLVDYDDQNLETYNNSDNNRDIYVFSTDNAGNFRWDKMIGGWGMDHATSINLDDQNNVYVSGTAINYNYSPPPVHFDTDTIKTIPENDEADPMNKAAFLIKYDQDGNYQWLVEPEGVNNISYGLYYFNALVLKTVVDPDGTSHSLIKFGPGTHLDGQLNVPEGEEIPQAGHQVVIVKYDTNGSLDGFVEIDMEPVNHFTNHYGYQLAYDPSLDRYYIADMQRKISDTISINGYGEGSGNNKAFYLAAVDNQGEVLWYQEDHYGNSKSLGGIQLDEEGNIYFTGMFTKPSDSQPSNNFAGYEFTMQEGNKSPFLMKLDPDGNLIWGTNGETYSPFPGESIALHGNTVYLGMPSLQNQWGDLAIPGPSGEGLVPDPIIIKFDAMTGTPQEVIHMPESPSGRNGFTAIGVDNNGDIIGGGYFHNYLFYDEPFAIFNSGGPSDFFIAKYQTDTEDNPCTPPTDLAVDNIEAESVKVSWTPGGEEAQWEVAYGAPGFDPETEGTSITVSTDPETTLEDLDSETDYIVYVRALCAEDSHSSWAGSVSFTTGDLAVEEHQTQVLKVYPNPTTGILNLQSEIGLESYKLFDLQGRVVQEGKLRNNQVDLSRIENGLYFLHVQDQNGGVENLKVVKE